MAKCTNLCKMTHLMVAYQLTQICITNIVGCYCPESLGYFFLEESPSGSICCNRMKETEKMGEGHRERKRERDRKKEREIESEMCQTKSKDLFII